jgi:hypothetical protein
MILRRRVVAFAPRHNFPDRISKPDAKFRYKVRRTFDSNSHTKITYDFKIIPAHVANVNEAYFDRLPRAWPSLRDRAGGSQNGTFSSSCQPRRRRLSHCGIHCLERARRPTHGRDSGVIKLAGASTYHVNLNNTGVHRARAINSRQHR